ncbi:MAG: hypothetical protein ACREX3_14650 [Gammaproteobacteria bacterium]
MRLPIVIAAVLTIAACGTPGRPHLAMALPDPAPLISKCWELRSVGWGDSFLPPGLRVRFDTARAGDAGSPWRLLQVQSVDSGFTNRLRIARWAPYERHDSTLAVLGDGFTGLELRLNVGSTSLRGVAYRISDTPHMRSGGAVSGARVDC